MVGGLASSHHSHIPECHRDSRSLPNLNQKKVGGLNRSFHIPVRGIRIPDSMSHPVTHQMDGMLL